MGWQSVGAGRVSLPPPPPGFSLDNEKPRKAKGPPEPPEGFMLDHPTGEAVDGDTLRLDGGRNLRLWGVDAPERKQLGWDRQGNAVRIGQNATAALDSISTPAGKIGPVQQLSYGRPVAPVTQSGADVGESLARSGNALAAPEYLGSDPPRRFRYNQAERLARLNGLGVHDTFHQSPSEFRKAPVTPERETVAQFWDTPTPLAGMRPEVEAEYVGLLQNGTADEIVSFVEATGGFKVDPAETRHYVEQRDKAKAQGQDLPAYANYADTPKPLTDLGDGATGAAVRGAGSGVLAGGLDELGAVADSVGLTPGRESVWNSDRRLADIVANNQRQNSAILGYDESAHPYATLGSQIAGGLIVPFGAKAKTIPQLFRVGAAYGGAEGFLGTDGDIGQRAIGGAIGVPLGGAIGAAGGKALELAAPVAGRLARRLLGKAPENAPQRALSDPGNIPPPPDGFALDESPARSIGMDTEPMDSISAPIRKPDYLDMGQRPRPLLRDTTEAELKAAASDIGPGDIVPIPSNVVGDVEEAAAKDAGRFQPAKPVNERDQLTRQTVRAWNGAEVPKVGPIDMVGWLRLNGGLANQGDELSHMGLTNAARKMDFVGQEARFGPLVDEQGMTLDDAALQAWEAGYFPDHAERPSVNEFLDALRDTHEGRNRRFLADDMAEIERYQGAQADRYDLEERLGDGPVYQDRSVSADEPQPLPPVEAYEEWPAGGPDFAGNINLAKLESPQDISRALSAVNNRVGFDAATRGRVSHAETERLASELNLTPDQLIGRRKGLAFNAEEALAARQILAKSGNELVNAAKRIRGLENPGDELLSEFRQKLIRHAAIQEQVAGATAEAGRALSQFRMLADSRMVRGEVLSGIVNAGGGKAGLKDAADVLLDAVETSPGQFNEMAEKVSKPGFKDMAIELWYNSLLSGPQTHAVNITSNTLTALGQLPEHALAATIGAGRRAASKEWTDRVLFSEVGARAFGLLQGAKEGMAHAVRSFRTGEPSDFITKVESQSNKAIPGKVGEVLRTPTRALMAEDEFFKAIARRMEISGLAVRQAGKEGLKGDKAKARVAELVANPTDEMLRRSMDYGRYLTFQRPLGEIGSLATAATQKAPILKLVVPFVRTPVNLLKFATERSPAAPLLKEWRKDFKAGGARRDLAIARSMVGTGVGMAMYQAALQGKITGSPPADASKRRLLYADGWQPYSVKVGDQWLSYKRLDPFSTTLGVAADMATLGEGLTKKQQENKATLLVASIMGNLASKTWLSGISDVLGALDAPEMNAAKFVKRLSGSLAVPTGVAQVARTMDPTLRETPGVSDYIQSRIPGLSDDLMPRRNIWGDEIVNEGGVGPNIVSPLWKSTAQDDPVNKAMLEIGSPASNTPKKVEGRELPPEQYDRYAELAGKTAHSRLTDLVTGPGWNDMDDEARRKAVSKTIRVARKDARDQLFGGEPNVPIVSNVPAPPSGFSVDGESAGRNVYNDLQAAIPGVRFTSGYRNEAYQADMRRRGYKPAYNSAHLDGSAMDMLPPPGKSMGWLKAQVKRYDPKARLLIHDGHLHATFPGYYGAPVLGGAKGAGLKNPLVGMPPPPDGFVLGAR